LDDLARDIANIPGVFEHGLFLKLASLAIVADAGKVKKISI
jgi:ribose 5-phosphate isomerase